MGEEGEGKCNKGTGGNLGMGVIYMFSALIMVIVSSVHTYILNFANYIPDNDELQL